MKQQNLFREEELPPPNRLTQEQIEDLSVRTCGNLYYYYPEQLTLLVKTVEDVIRGKI